CGNGRISSTRTASLPLQEVPVIPIRGLTVCVDYDDILALTLPRNMRHLSECLVVTSLDDEKTADLAGRVPRVTLFQTDAFRRDGAFFNKGRAIEEALDVLGRFGWMLIWDADIVFPDEIDLGPLDAQALYSAPRRLLMEGALEFDADWSSYKVTPDLAGTGYFQLFHSAANALRSRPWYPTDCAHAGWSDWSFALKFAEGDRRWLPIDVLHIGRRDENWFGRATPRLDGEPIKNVNFRRRKMAEYLLTIGQTWHRPDLQTQADALTNKC